MGALPGVSGKFKLDSLGMDSVVMEVVELPEEFQRAAPAEAKHIICVKRSAGGVEFGMMFGGHFLIDNLSVLALYWPDTQELECFHCLRCAVLVLDWFKEMQGEWQSIYSSNVNESTGEGPKRSIQ